MLWASQFFTIFSGLDKVFKAKATFSMWEHRERSHGEEVTVGSQTMRRICQAEMGVGTGRCSKQSKK